MGRKLVRIVIPLDFFLWDLKSQQQQAPRRRQKRAFFAFTTHVCAVSKKQFKRCDMRSGGIKKINFPPRSRQHEKLLSITTSISYNFLYNLTLMCVCVCACATNSAAHIKQCASQRQSNISPTQCERICKNE
jgi:hypothetical protein